MNKLPNGPYKLPCLCELGGLILTRADRCERLENPRIYMKAIRSTLIAIGYDEDFVNGPFRDYMEKIYDSSGTHIFI